MTLHRPNPPDPDSESSFAKTRLFCLRCDHASPVDGDWIADDASTGRQLLCPRCGAVVVDDPTLAR